MPLGRSSVLGSFFSILTNYYAPNEVGNDKIKSGKTLETIYQENTAKKERRITAFLKLCFCSQNIDQLIDAGCIWNSSQLNDTQFYHIIVEM